jgi:hypothetical protein
MDWGRASCWVGFFNWGCMHGSIDRSLMGFYGGIFSLGLGSGLSCWGRVIVGDIPNGYTSDVVLNQQARVAHQGGMADCLPGGPVAGDTMAVLDVGAHGGSKDRPMAGCLVVHA